MDGEKSARLGSFIACWKHHKIGRVFGCLAGGFFFLFLFHTFPISSPVSTLPPLPTAFYFAGYFLFKFFFFYSLEKVVVIACVQL